MKEKNVMIAKSPQRQTEDKTEKVGEVQTDRAINKVRQRALTRKKQYKKVNMHLQEEERHKDMKIHKYRSKEKGNRGRKTIYLILFMMSLLDSQHVTCF